MERAENNDTEAECSKDALLFMVSYRLMVSWPIDFGLIRQDKISRFLMLL